ncbi:hypothetical protein ACIBEJ_38915 [Nonomuraea sp. NPDC050790]|uniref:hypothetical protein n=1 Tax=Nonomuraea sp. NPDC050790 TaxID=3364371 RepID=UPI00379BF257
MAIPKKGSRLITVDGVRYRWRIRHKPSYGQGIGEEPATVRPALVAMAITRALQSGWHPTHRGSQVRLSLSRDDLAGLADIRPTLSFTAHHEQAS